MTMTPADRDPRSPFDAWATDNVAFHVDSIRDRLGVGLGGPRPPSVVVDPETGHLSKGRLCWVCFGQVPFRGRFLPRFRACRSCLIFDGQQAEKLGYTMLLPLMDYASQPIRSDSVVPRDPHLRGVLADVWSQVSLLIRWRVQGVRLGYSMFDPDADGAWDGDGRIKFSAWCDWINGGPARSAACWKGFVKGQYPDLHARLQVAGSWLPS